MMRDLQAMCSDYMEVQAMTGSAGYMQGARAAELVEVIASMHDSVMDNGIAQGVLTAAKVTSLYCSTADRQWLRDQISVDTLSRPYNVWSKLNYSDKYD